MFWTKKQSFAARVEAAMVSLNARMSGKVLENRNNTIGASEINGCGRRVILGKLHPEKHPAKTLAKFFRGHRQEEFNAPLHRQIAMEEGTCWIPQVRVEHPDNPRLRAHVDNVYYVSPTRRIEDATSICVVEEKNAAQLAVEPMDDHVAQVHFQMGLLALRYPRAEVFGYVYQTDLNGDHTDFDGRMELDMDKANALFERGFNLLAWLDAKEVPEPQPGMKCPWCIHQSTCPSWQGENVPVTKELMERFKEYHELNRRVSALTKERDAVKEGLLQFLGTMGPKVKFAREGYVISLSTTPGRKTASLEMLEEKYPGIAAEVVSKGLPYRTLRVDYKPAKEVTQ